MKDDLESLFRDAGRLSPSPDLWRRIAENSSLSRSGERRRERLEWLEWLDFRYLRAAGVVLAAGLLALAAYGFLRHRPDEPVREASLDLSNASGESANEVFDSELLGWQADLGDYEWVADEAEEAL